MLRRHVSLPDSMSIGLLIEGMPLGIAVLDAELRYVAVNDALARQNGRSRDEHVGRFVREVVPDLGEHVLEQLRSVLATGASVEDFDVIVATPADPASPRVWRESIRPLRDEAGATVGLIVGVMDVTQERSAQDALEHAVERSTSLGQLTRALSAAVSVDDIGRAVIAHLVPALGGTWGAIGTLDPAVSMQQFATFVRHGPDFAPERAALSLRPDEPLGWCTLTCEESWCDSDAALRAAFPQHVEHEHVIGATATLPLLRSGRVLGAIGIARDVDLPWSEEDRELLRQVADQTAEAIERAHLFEAERLARTRTSVLAWLGRRLAEDLDVEEIGALAAEAVREGLGAETSGLALLNEEREELELVAAPGHEPAVLAELRHLPISRVAPVASAMETRRTLWWSSAAAISADFPDTPSYIRQEPGLEALIVTPLTLGERILGGLRARFRDVRSFRDEELRFIGAVADAAAQAIQRSRLTAAERQHMSEIARHLEAERASRERALILAEHNGELTRDLSIEEFGRLAAQAVVRGLGAAGARLALVEEGDRLVTVGSQGYADEEISAIDEQPLALRPVAAAIRSNRTQVFETPEALAAAFPEFVAGAHASHAGAAAVAPLIVDGAPIGGLHVDFAEARSFEQDDVAFVRAIADSAAQAIARIRLNEGERSARRRSTALARFAAQLTLELTVTTIAELAEGALTEGLHAREAAVFLRDRDTNRLELIASQSFSDRWLELHRRLDLDVPTPVASAVRNASMVAWRDGPALSDAHEAATPSAVSGSGASAIVPMIVHGEAMGAILMQRGEPHAWQPDELAFLRAVADSAAQAIARAQITEAERQARHLLDAVLEQMPVGIAIVDAHDGSIRRNRYHAEMWHESGEDFTLSTYTAHRAFHPDGRPFETGEWGVSRALRGERVLEMEATIERADGTRAIIATSAAPVRDAEGRIIAGVIVATDITQRREQEKLRDAFIGILSHELRTPVTSIYGGTKLLLKREATLAPDVRAGIMQDVAGESERLLRIVEDLLVLSRIERGVELVADEPVLVQHVVRRVVEAERLLWPGATFELSVTPDLPPVLGSDNYLDQILRNVIGNAAKYAGGLVEITVGADAGVVSVTVRDHGPGIPDEDAPRIFDLFYRSAVAERRTAGAGIGLFVASRLVTAMDGQISAENAPGGGACFRILLPLHDE